MAEWTQRRNPGEGPRLPTWHDPTRCCQVCTHSVMGLPAATRLPADPYFYYFKARA